MSEKDHYILPFSTYMKVFAALIGLTFLTVLTAKGMDLHPFNGVVAFGIAAAKAGLVMAFFMQLLYSDRLNSLIIFGSFGFVLILFVFCIIDIYTRIQPVNTF